MTTLPIDLPMDVIADFCRRHRIVRLELFGSALREDFRPESDLDFLYVQAPDHTWSFTERLDAEDELKGLLGRDVDLVSRQAAEEQQNPWRRKNILGSARVIYAA